MNIENLERRTKGEEREAASEWCIGSPSSSVGGSAAAVVRCRAALAIANT